MENNQYEAILRGLQEARMGADMFDDEEISLRLGRAIQAFKFNNLDQETMDNMTWREIYESVIQDNVNSALEDYKRHFKENNDD